MGSEGALELLFFGWAAITRRTRAPSIPLWGRGLRRVLVNAFAVVGRALFDLRVAGGENFTNRPATLVVSNHKTDFDIVLLSPVLYRTHRGKGPIARLAYVAAERMFEPGYFSTYLVPRPRWLSRMLFPANLSAILQALHAYPIPHSNRRKLGHYLRELLQREGDVPLTAIFRHPVPSVIPELSERARVRESLRWRHRDALDRERDCSVFAPALGKKLREQHVEDIFASLGLFASILGAGDAVYFAPEGQMSTSGKFGGIKAGMTRMLELVERDVTVLPLNFTYDFMASGRTTAFLSIGPEMRGANRLPKGEFEGHVERSIVDLGMVTLTQLAASVLRGHEREGEHEVDAVQLRDRVHRWAGELAERGYAVDRRLLEREKLERRWQRFVRYGRQRGLFESHGRRLRFTSRAVQLPGGPWVAPWRYGENELRTILGGEASG